MKRFVFIVLGLLSVAYLAGCGKKQDAEEMQEPVSIEALSTVSTETKTTAPDSKAQPEQGAPAATVTQEPVKLEPLPPSGPYKPTVQEMQTALKNAGYYSGAIDGKKGPMTTKAVEEFQKANALKADGKVGPKTWDLLKSHLNPPVEDPAKKNNKR